VFYVRYVSMRCAIYVTLHTYDMTSQGFHEFAEFTAEDVGTVDSGLNSCVLANNNEMILLPINEPTFGTRRKSQIQTYLEQNEVRHRSH
jgi:4-hydroxyphenylpyruvate dioxygenase